MQREYLIAITLVAAIVVGVTLFLFTRNDTPLPERPAPVVVPPPEPVPEEPATEAQEVLPPTPSLAETGVVLPSLNESDAFVRERLPESVPEEWLKDDLIRRGVVVIENASRGELPRRQLGYLAPEGEFKVREAPGSTPESPRYVIDPASYARYDRYLDTLEALPPEELAKLVTETYPLLDEALAELGVQGQVLPQILEAIDQVLAVPELTGDVELVQPKVLYEYADPALEALSPLQKQVLRMGPDNVRRLKAYLGRLRTELIRQ